MAFLEMLSEMLTRSQVSDLVRNVAVMNVERDENGDSSKYLYLHYAKKGKIQWVQNTVPGIFMMKGKFIKEVYPMVKGRLGKVKFVDRDEVRKGLEYGSVGAIQTDTDMPSSFISNRRSEVD
jgi:hypothetical protein